MWGPVWPGLEGCVGGRVGYGRDSFESTLETYIKAWSGLAWWGMMRYVEAWYGFIRLQNITYILRYGGMGLGWMSFG